MTPASLLLGLLIPVINVIVIVDPTYDPIIRSNLQVGDVVINQNVSVSISCQNTTPNPDYPSHTFPDVQAGISLYSLLDNNKKYIVSEGTPGTLSNNGNGLYYLTDGSFTAGETVTFNATLTPPVGLQVGENLRLVAWCRSTEQSALMYGDDSTLVIQASGSGGGSSSTSSSTTSSSGSSQTTGSTTTTSSSTTTRTTSSSRSSSSSTTRPVTEEVLPGVDASDENILPPIFRQIGNVTTKLQGISSLELASLQAFTLDVPPLGQIKYTVPVDLNNLYDNGKLLELDKYVIIGRGFVEVNSEEVPELSGPALIVMRDLDLNPGSPIVILKDDVPASPDDVFNIAYNPDTDVLSFNVAHFTRYEVKQDDLPVAFFDIFTGGMLALILMGLVVIGALGSVVYIRAKQGRELV